MGLIGPFNSGVAVGDNGSATANTDSTIMVRGFVMQAYIQYNDSPPAGTTDVTIRTKGTSPAAPSYNILKVSNAATNGLFVPRKVAVDQTGAALSGENVIQVEDKVNILIEGANAGDSADVWLFVL